MQSSIKKNIKTNRDKPCIDEKEVNALKKILEYEESTSMSSISVVKCECGVSLPLKDMLVHCRATNHYSRDVLNTGWVWSDVGISPKTINKLIELGIIGITYRSRSETRYKVIDVDTARTLIETLTYEPNPDTDSHCDRISIPNDFMDTVVGYNDLKTLIIGALTADKPVHILFVGPPATAKSVILMDCAKIDGVKYAIGGSSTYAGISEFLIEHRPRVLIIDEIDKMDRIDMSVLLSVMETGHISIIKHNKVYEDTIHLTVLAAANRIDRLPSELVSRFLVVNLKSYSQQELHTVIVNVLTKREGCDPILASYIAEKCVLNGFNDVREAVRIYRLAKSKDDVDRILSTIEKYKTK